MWSERHGAERQGRDVLWSGWIQTIEIFDQVQAVEVVVWLPSVFTCVVAFPFDQVLHRVVAKMAV
jgi:hypothetical protein